MEPTAEYVIYEVYENGRQGKEVWRGQASTYKWGPSNAMRLFARVVRPTAGKYLVAGPLPGGRDVFSIYELAYPTYAIEGTGAGGWDFFYHPAPEPEETPDS